MYLAKGVDVFSELNLYEKGCCQPSTQGISEWDINFENKTLEGLMRKIKEYHDLDAENTDAVELLEGELSVHTTEVADKWAWRKPSDRDLILWQKGGLEIYNCIYRYNIFKKLD